MALLKHEIFKIFNDCDDDPSYNPYVEIIELPSGEVLFDFYAKKKQGLEEALTYNDIKEKLEEIEDAPVITVASESEVVNIFIER